MNFEKIKTLKLVFPYVRIYPYLRLSPPEKTNWVIANDDFITKFVQFQILREREKRKKRRKHELKGIKLIY